MKRTIVIGVAALVFAATASAATPTGGWTKPDMKTAIRGLGYPKPHPKKLGCKAAGSTAFRCVATYRHHRHRRFVIGGTGVWLCTGKTLDGCNWLHHGFVTSTQLEQHYAGHLATAALFAARGYMAIKYGITYTVVAPGGGQTGPKQTRGGYVVSATAS
jgi:hypothetical protein